MLQKLVTPGLAVIKAARSQPEIPDSMARSPCLIRVQMYLASGPDALDQTGFLRYMLLPAPTSPQPNNIKDLFDFLLNDYYLKLCFTTRIYLIRSE